MTTRLYTVPFSGLASAAQIDFFEVTPAAAKPTIIHRAYIAQVTEVGDTQEESLLITMRIGSTTTGSGGTTVTPPPIGPSDAAYGGVVKTGSTTQATGGTPTVLRHWAWNVRIPFDFVWTPEARPVIAGSSRMVILLAQTPADSITYCGFLEIEEIG